MPYIRLSIMKPRPGEAQRIEDFMRKLTGLVRRTGGLHRELPHEARTMIVATLHASPSTATSRRGEFRQQPAVMAVRSEIHLLSEPGHIERAFFSI